MTAVATAPLTRTRGAAASLWRFSRPHTIVGTALSVAGIYAIAAHELSAPPAHDLALTLLAALAVNVFIVGINQITDVDIDRINKPWLPLASGDLTPAQAQAIVAASGMLPLALALTQGLVELVAVAAALAIGAAYSLPPVRLKRFPALAAASISIVRAFVVNLGVYLHFSAGESVAPAVWALTLFVLPFAFAIAVLKDVPDAEGDRHFAIRTFTVRFGGRAAFRLGLAALAVAYLGMALLAFEGADRVVLAVTHIGALVLLLAWASRTDPSDPVRFTSFYMRVWALFFAEYLVVPLAVIA